MKYVHIDNVEPGELLGKTIFAANGAVLLAENVQLTVFMITTLRRIGVTMLYIKDPNFEDVDIPEVLSSQTKQAVMKQMGETFDAIRSGKEFSGKHVNFSINQLIDELVKNKEVLLQLTDIRTKDNELYVHGLNVCTIAVMIGLGMSLNMLQLKDLAVGALLHDVGKVDPLVNDKAEDIKLHHTWRGFEVLKMKRELSLLVAHVALQHHETLDGQGVPRNLTSENIHLFAKITAVANLYDNLIFSLMKGYRMLPHEACEYMMALSSTAIDRDVLMAFLDIVSVYPTGSSVRLSTRETGVVVGQHRGIPMRPIVRVATSVGDSELEVKEVDLLKQKTVFIEAVLT
jgi:HD-GYP domain-containing protein (c-di-GMP phosphodiesterase class II)